MGNKTPKQQVRDFIKEGLGRAVMYFETSQGLHHDITAEMLGEMSMLEQLSFLNEMFKSHPALFKGMPRFYGN